MPADRYILRDSAVLASLMADLANLPREPLMEVVVQRHRKRRSLSQNALMWKWINEVAEHVQEHTGMDSDEVHAFFKQKFLTPRMIEINGETVPYYTTTKLSTQDMSAYMDRIYAFCTQELGLRLPLPEEAHMRAA